MLTKSTPGMFPAAEVARDPSAASRAECSWDDSVSADMRAPIRQTSKLPPSLCSQEIPLTKTGLGSGGGRCIGLCNVFARVTPRPGITPASGLPRLWLDE